jgi:hypothetical protein
MAQDISVFQDLSLHCDTITLTDIRSALLKQATGPWRHAEERENKIPAHSSGDDVIVFTREKGGGIEAVNLFMFSNNSVYKVTNIVPSQIGELSIDCYNSVLKDFVVHVVEPARRTVDFQIDITSARQSLNDWVSSDVAEALRRFSGSANKSTGSSHPLDLQRWFRFIVVSHREPEKLGTDRLIRWLVEVENWPEEKAYDLAIEYEFGLGILEAYDKA